MKGCFAVEAIEIRSISRIACKSISVASKNQSLGITARYGAIISRKMPLDLHCIVQDAADSNHISACEAIEQEMPGPVNDATLVSRPVAAMAKMVAAHIVAKFWPTDASGSVRPQGYVAKRRDKKPFVTQSSRFSEMLLRPSKNIDDVRLRGIGEAIIGHKAMRRPCGLGFQPPDRADRYNLLARRLAHP